MVLECDPRYFAIALLLDQFFESLLTDNVAAEVSVSLSRVNVAGFGLSVGGEVEVSSHVPRHPCPYSR